MQPDPELASVAGVFYTQSRVSGLEEQRSYTLRPIAALPSRQSTVGARPLDSAPATAIVGFVIAYWRSLLPVNFLTPEVT
jgi:hypothetical protein